MMTEDGALNSGPIQEPGSKNTERSVEVLIVGAGPTGLTLACELTRRGVRSRVVEASQGPQPGSRGKGFQPRTLEVFDDLGIVDRVIANGKMGMPIRRAVDGNFIQSDNELLAPTPDTPYPASLITPEWRVEEALRLRLAEFGGIVEFGSALDSFELFDDFVSALVIRDGAIETITARWLVGCDGSHSTVRKQAGIAFRGETRGEVRMIVADMLVDGLTREAWHMWSHEEGFVSLCPLPSTDLFQFQAGITPGQNPDLSLGNMQTLLERRSGNADISLRDLRWTSLWRANVRLAEHYRNDRILLAGDAAHIHSPAGGQGMNTGIQDAQNLGWKLAAVVKGATLALLESYEAERRPIAEGVLALSNARLEQALEQKQLPTGRDRNTTQLSLAYRGSSLARDDREQTASLRAGDRAPDAAKLKTFKGECRLFDLMRGTHFTLINFGPSAAVVTTSHEIRMLHVVKELCQPNDVFDCEGHLAIVYRAAASTCVLIRPDGYIALISDAGDISAITAYLISIS